MIEQKTLPSAIGADERGVTVIEFALLAPVLLITLLGMFDMGYTMYAQTLLQGALQQAARNSTIEGAASSTATIANAISAGAMPSHANEEGSIVTKVRWPPGLRIGHECS